MRDQRHIVDSKTESASAVPRPAPFGKLASRLAFFFFFFLPPSFSFGQREIASVPLKILELICKPEETAAVKALLRNSLMWG